MTPHPFPRSQALLAAGIAAILAATASPAQAAAVYSEHWDGPASTQGWGPNGSQVQVSGDAGIGLPPGSLTSLFVPDGSPDRVIGAQSGNLALRGYAPDTNWTVSFDILLVHGPVEQFSLRYPVYDMAGQGWRKPLPVPDAGDWAHIEVSFDTGWTDDEALAAGWLKDQPFVPSFSMSMEYALGTELRLELVDAPSTTTALVRFDNFVQQTGTVPTPPSALLAALALAGLAGVNRRRAQPGRRASSSPARFS